MHSSPYQQLNKTRHLLQNSMLQNPCRESQVLRFEMCKPGAALPHPCLGCTADWLSPALCPLGLPHQLGIPIRVVSAVLASSMNLKPMSWHASVGVEPGSSLTCYLASAVTAGGSHLCHHLALLRPCGTVLCQRVQTKPASKGNGAENSAQRKPKLYGRQ